MSKTVERFQITTFEKFSQFSRVADRSIITGLKWEDVAKWLDRSTTGNQFEADQRTINGWTYSYMDEDGKRCELARYLLPEAL